MSLGVFLKAFNNVYFGKYVDLFFEFLPQIILLWVLFGWMDILIVIKWLHTMNIESDDAIMKETVHYAPSIITTMINEFLNFGTKPDNLPYSLFFEG